MKRFFKPYFLLFALAIIALLLVQSVFIKNTSTVVITTVTDKERVTYQNGETIDSKYLIFTEAETFECTDQLLVGKVNSSDVYGMIQKDKKYKFTVYGVRIPFLSMYRNIVNVELVK